MNAGSGSLKVSKREKLKLLEKQKRTLAKTSFKEFCYVTGGYVPARHHKVLIEKLEAVVRGDIKRLMFFLPPGHAKSTYSSMFFPAWYLGVKPKNCIIGASHTTDLAEHFSRKARNIVGSEEYREIFGFGIGSITSINAWDTEKGGEFKAAGVGAGIAGRRADLALIDDPIKKLEDAESETMRLKTWDWFLADLTTRLKPEGSIILIQTRWHEEDLAGRILPPDYHGQSGKITCTGGEEWEVVNLPLIAEHPDDALGRQPGECLWPEYYNQEIAEGIRRIQTPRIYSALYQQRPRPLEGNQFDGIKFLVNGQPVPYPKTCDFVFAVQDTAVKTGSKNDGTGTSYYAMSKFYGIPLILLDWDIAQITGALLEDYLPNVESRLEELAKQCGARLGSLGIFIEDKQTGTVLLQQNDPNVHRLNGGKKVKCHAIDSKLTAVGKDERAVNVSGYVHNEKLKISEYAYNKKVIYKGRELNHWWHQVTTFKVGSANSNQADDLLDTMTYGLSIALGDSNGY